jgi:hypothetical protein
LLKLKLHPRSDQMLSSELGLFFIDDFCSNNVSVVRRSRTRRTFMKLRRCSSDGKQGSRPEHVPSFLCFRLEIAVHFPTSLSPSLDGRAYNHPIRWQHCYCTAFLSLATTTKSHTHQLRRISASWSNSDHIQKGISLSCKRMVKNLCTL